MAKRKLSASDRKLVDELLRRLQKFDGKLKRAPTDGELQQQRLARWEAIPDVDPIEGERSIAELSETRTRTAERLKKARAAVGRKRAERLKANQTHLSEIRELRRKGVPDAVIAERLVINRKRLVRLAGKRGR